MDQIHPFKISELLQKQMVNERLWYSETQFNNQLTYSNQNINPTMLHIIYFTPGINLT